jgi:tetratricopeptide (TPR) repeat protein
MIECIDPKIGAWINDYCLDDLAGPEVARFEEHMYACEYCRQEVLELSQLLRALRQYSQVLAEAPAGHWWPFGKLAFVVLVILAVLILSTPYVLRPAYSELAAITEERVPVLRGEASRLEAVQLYNQRNYQGALAVLESYMKSAPPDYQALYLSALCALHLSDRRLGGLHLSFNQDLVRQAIGYLDRAEPLAANDYAREDCYWLLGKAYLRLASKSQAAVYFQKILDLEQKGLIRKQPARQILTDLNTP